MTVRCDKCGGDLVERRAGFGSSSVTVFIILFLISLGGTIAIPLLLPLWILVLIGSLIMPFVLRKREMICNQCGE